MELKTIEISSPRVAYPRQQGDSWELRQVEVQSVDAGDVQHWIDARLVLAVDSERSTIALLLLREDSVQKEKE